MTKSNFQCLPFLTYYCVQKHSYLSSSTIEFQPFLICIIRVFEYSRTSMMARSRFSQYKFDL